ncbi:hypothetical protein CRG98_015619 [Punica granatum]|uniref:G-patch domain-containing protein n=1 Tax=Punica granatum TaxID=22663 RepID=A0A2I0K8G5_PUNGR|nr:hypothetical protein CRG98_015619 [Punica granatum]
MVFLSVSYVICANWGRVDVGLMKGIYYSHLLAHISSFSDLIEAGKKLDLGIKLGRMEGPNGKGEESSKKVPATTSSSGGRRGKEVSVNAVNPTQPTPQQYSVNFATSPTAAPAYFPPPPQHQHQSVYYSAPPGPSPMASQPFDHHYATAPTSPRPPDNPLPDQRPSSGPSINMISICASGRDEDAQDNPLPFVIDYTPDEPTVGFAGRMASPAPFVVDIPAREPYADSKVPWTYEGSVGSVEQQFSVMGMTSSRWAYENPMNVDLNRVRPSKTAIRAFDGSRREKKRTTPSTRRRPVLVQHHVPSARHPERVQPTAREALDLLGRRRLLFSTPKAEIYRRGEAHHGERRRGLRHLQGDGPCSFSITFQVLDIPNAFSLLLGRPWIYSAGAVSSSLHQRLKFIVEEKLIMVKEEEDYAIYKETAVPYISVSDDENLPFHSFETISVIRDYGEIGPSHTDHMIGKVLLRNNYVPGIVLGAREQGISRPIEIEEYKHRRGLGFRPSCHEIIEARRGYHLHRLAAHYGRLNRGIPVPPVISLHSNPNPRHFESSPFQEHLGEPQPVYFGEGLPKDSQVPEIGESLRRLEDHQITSVEPTEEINVGTEEESRTLKIGTALDLAQRARMIDFLREYQEVFAWSYADMPGLDPSIVEHFLPLDTEKFPPKRQQLRRQRASLLLRIKERQTDQRRVPRSLQLFRNTGATYQRAMVTLFCDMMHKEVEVYVDDMIAKSKEGEDHLVNLKRLFDRLKEYKLRLNPAKCTFGARSGKLLGFVVSERGIEVDPDKVKAIKELPPPSTVREVRGFLGRLNYIARFIANLTDKCQPLFRLLRKNAAMEWDHECQKAFDTIQAYLIQPPILVPLVPNRPLILYLTVRRQSLGCMLGQEDESTRTERAIYYLSKKFTEGESNYPEFEKMCCALLWVMQRLRQ